MSVNLGELTTVHQGLLGDGYDEFNILAAIGVPTAANGDAVTADQTIADKAVADSKEVPSIWFANFPTQQAAGQQKLLAKYMANVNKYRCWASLVWWRTVYGQPKIPQDGSDTSKAIRNAYCAQVAFKHMTLTPWLAMNSNNNISKSITCKVTDFHTELIQAVLEGFVVPTLAIFTTLEQILQSLRKTISSSNDNKDHRTIVCERYEYIPEANVIRSYVRIISFTVTDSIKNVQNAKMTEQDVTCAISYTDYEAVFNQELWNQAAATINEAQKKATEQFVGDQTVDCPP